MAFSATSLFHLLHLHPRGLNRWLRYGHQGKKINGMASSCGHLVENYFSPSREIRAQERNCIRRRGRERGGGEERKPYEGISVKHHKSIMP